jgi:hypothetical protein
VSALAAKTDIRSALMVSASKLLPSVSPTASTKSVLTATLGISWTTLGQSQSALTASLAATTSMANACPAALPSATSLTQCPAQLTVVSLISWEGAKLAPLPTN